MRHCIYAGTSCPLLNISCIGYAEDASVTRFGPGVRNSYIIHYVISGRGCFNGAPVTAGQGFLITPGMQEHYHPDSHDPWKYLWFTSGDPTMKNLFPLFHADEQTHIFSFEGIPVLRELADFLLANKNGVYDAYEMLEHFLRIFKYHPGKNAPHPTGSNARLYTQAAVKYISANLHRPITVEELAAFLGVSQPYLYKVFKERYQQSPKQYILWQKLRLAQSLLTETDISVTAIAHSTGFPDVLSFSKCFHTKLGLSPKQYRNRITP